MIKLISTIVAGIAVLVGLIAVFTGQPDGALQQIVYQNYLTHGLLAGLFFIGVGLLWSKGN